MSMITQFWIIIISIPTANSKSGNFLYMKMKLVLQFHFLSPSFESKWWFLHSKHKGIPPNFSLLFPLKSTRTSNLNHFISLISWFRGFTFLISSLWWGFSKSCPLLFHRFRERTIFNNCSRYPTSGSGCLQQVALPNQYHHFLGLPYTWFDVRFNHLGDDNISWGKVSEI